ncbi:MAG: glycosyltransferase, partial [Paraburkholderia hospita]
GEIGEAEKREFLGNAHALVFPIDWPEPFGLVMIEAMACGTPVIAFKRGSVPEVIENGVSGFVVEDEISAVAALKRLDQLPRAQVRKAFESRFSSKVMAKNYLKTYEELLHAKRRTVLREVNAS